MIRCPDERSCLYTSRDSSELLERMLPKVSAANIIWDFDGVVAHSEPMHEQSYVVLGQRRSHKLAEDYFAPLVGHTERWIWDRLIAAGFPAKNAEIEALLAERAEVVAALAGESLDPSWLAAT